MLLKYIDFELLWLKYNIDFFVVVGFKKEKLGIFMLMYLVIWDIFFECRIVFGIELSIVLRK